MCAHFTGIRGELAGLADDLSIRRRVYVANALAYINLQPLIKTMPSNWALFSRPQTSLIAVSAANGTCLWCFYSVGIALEWLASAAHPFPIRHISECNDHGIILHEIG